MGEAEQVKREVELRRKIDDAKRRAFEAEIQRLERETEQRSTALSKMFQAKDEHLVDELTKEADQTRLREEALLKKRETEFLSRLQEERFKKKMRRAEDDRLRREQERLRIVREQKLRAEEEARRKADEERDLQDEFSRRERDEQMRLEMERRQREAEAARKADEERLRQEEQMRVQREEFMRQQEEHQRQESARKRLEEEIRQRDAEDRKRREEERVKKEAAEKLRLEEELRRQLEERQRQEAELLRQQAEALQRAEEEKKKSEADKKQARLRELISKAETFLAQNNFEHALVEVAKALVNDPANETAIELEKKIKEAQGLAEPEKNEAKKSTRTKPVRQDLKPQFESKEKPKNLFTRPVYLIAASLIVVVIGAVSVQLKNKIFPPKVSFAVLPLASTSHTAEEAAFGSSLSEEITKQIERYQKAVVMGYSSAYNLSQHGQDAAESAFRLGYSHVLQGSITKSELGISIDMKLVDSFGAVKWNEHYDLGAASLSSFPSEVAGQLTRVLDIQGKGGTNLLVTTLNADAFEHYLQGVELMHHRTRTNVEAALELFRKAITEDTNFAQALAAASSCVSVMVEENWTPADTGIACARNFAERAVRSNAALSDGYLALGTALSLKQDFAGALEQFNAGLKQSPNNSELYLEKGKAFIHLARYSEAITALSRTCELNPRDAGAIQTLGFAYQLDGKPDQGVLYHEAALGIVDDSLQYLLGPLADAILLDPNLSQTQSTRVMAACERRISSQPDDFPTIYRLGRLFQITGKRTEGTALLEQLEKKLRDKLKSEPTNGSAMVYLALTLTRLGRFPEATTWGQKAGELRGSDPVIKYRLAQMYSLQMYSPQRKKVDEKKRDEATKVLRNALSLSYRFDELTNADFYNMYKYSDFHNVVASAGQ